MARESYGRLLAYLAAHTRDVAGAEDALSDAFATALAEWPRTGIPRVPEAWLLTVARRKQLDAVRRRRTHEQAAPDLTRLVEERVDRGDESIPDDRLRLMFACAHPAIDADVRAPLILQTVLGLDAATIASAFLVAPATMGQRLVRAKSRIRMAGIPFRVPERGELSGRLDAVLEAIYAVYAEGWTDPWGTQARRRGLAEEGIWLGRLVVSLLPEEPEASGLLALMLYTHSRREARRDAAGAFVPLDEQDPARWDLRSIEEAEALLFAACRMGRPGRFQIEAAIQSAHAARRFDGTIDWGAIVDLYDALLAITGSAVVAVNRAVALAERAGGREGAAAGLAALPRDPALGTYQPYWAARAELLARAGDPARAAAAYRSAIGLEADPAVRRFLQDALARVEEA